MAQAEGWIGRFVDGMIRRSVRSRFHTVHWVPPSKPLPEPCIFVPNHHGWHDGYLMYHAITALRIRTLDWIQEFDAFPLFAKVGGMPFPADDATRRGATIRKTIRLMTTEKRSLILFAEQHLHRPPEVMVFGKALELVSKRVPEACVVPVGIHYELSMHERPECFMMFGTPRTGKDATPEQTRLAVKALLDELAVKIKFDPEAFQVLVKGTLDVNERMDMRRVPRIGSR